MTPLLLSASSLTTYLRCGLQWYNAYVLGVKAPPTLKQARGIAVHAAVEVNLRQKIESRADLHPSEVADAFATSYDALSPEIEDEREEIGSYKDSGVRLSKLHTTHVAPEIQPIAVELPVQFLIGDVIYSGQVDVIDEMERVRDTKTTARRPAPEQYGMALTGYALAYRQLTGRTETDVVLDYLVATTKPYFLDVRVGEPVSDERITRFAGVVETVAAGIRRGSFVPNGAVSGACSWCGYRLTCPASTEKMR